MWGPYDSSHPDNAFGLAVMRGILDSAGVHYRVRHPLPRALCPYLGDHMEQASISANIAYNNTSRPQTITVRLPWKPVGHESMKVDGCFETAITIPAFSYSALQPESVAEPTP